jgi:5-methylcytosine-specific restriction endonuclease McrA
MQGILDERVLVLNRLWQAVNTCSARRALVLLYMGHAQAVSHDGDAAYRTHDFESWLQAQHGRDAEGHEIRTVTCTIRVPKIIVLALFDRFPKKEIKLTRANVFERDNHTCQYCGRRFERKQLNIDHVKPRDKGGKTTWENVVCSCVPCNTRKGNKLPHEANMRLLNKPKAPKWQPHVQLSHTGGLHESWRHFVDPHTWEVSLSN